MPGTVYSDLKIITDLVKDLEGLRANSKILETKRAEAMTEAQAAKLELQMLKEKTQGMEKKLKVSELQLELQQRENKMQQAHYEEIENRAKEYKGLYKQADGAQDALKQSLNKSNAMLSRLQNQNLLLENANEILRIENKLLGERLSGLLRSFTVSGQLRLEADLVEKLRQYKEYARQVYKDCDDIRHSLQNQYNDNLELKNDFTEVSAVYIDSKKDASNLVASLRSRITMHESTLQRVTEENNKLLAKGLQQDKNFKQLSLEHEKLIQKLKQHRAKRKQAGGIQEQLCKHCNKIYLDNENFNWSCRIHASEFGGEIWWCCGKTDPHALGCLLRKHESKDEDEEGIEALNLEEKESVKICSVSFYAELQAAWPYTPGLSA